MEAQVYLSSNGGATPEELAEQCADSLFFIGDNLPPEVEAEALEQKKKLIIILTKFMHRAVRHDRLTVSYLLKQKGHEDAAKFIKTL